MAARAPAAIVVQLSADAWHIAERLGAVQPDRSPDDGPVVLTYRLAPGHPYRSAQAAAGDASLILARSES